MSASIVSLAIVMTPALACARGNGNASGDGAGPDASMAAVDAVPPPVGDCSGLGPAGQWEQINPAGAYLGTFALDPVHVGTVWYTGKNPGPQRGLYKSSDCGHNW